MLLGRGLRSPSAFLVKSKLSMMTGRMNEMTYDGRE